MTPEELYAWAVAHAKQRQAQHAEAIKPLLVMPEQPPYTPPESPEAPLPSYRNEGSTSWDTREGRSNYLRQLVGLPDPNVLRTWVGLPPIR